MDYENIEICEHCQFEKDECYQRWLEAFTDCI